MRPEDIKTLQDKMDEVIKTNTDLAIANARLTERVADSCARFDNLHKDYYGNGDGGTRREVTTLRTQVGMILKVGGGVVTAVLASLAIAIMDIVRY